MTASNLKSADPSRTITSLHSKKIGKVSNKWSSYLGHYDRLFESIKNDPISLLEIGVQNGGSLETWGLYFENATVILGCDIDEKCSLLRFEDPRIKIIVGDVNSQPIHEAISKSGFFDAIIDDGSHLSEDILVGFLNYFPLVKPGGVYVVEDTHAIYMSEYQRGTYGIKNKKTAFGFFKELTDIVNFQFWARDEQIENLIQPYLSAPVPLFLLEGWVESIEFRNSIITIRKSFSPSHDKLGYMHVAGNVADVDAAPLKGKGNC